MNNKASIIIRTKNEERWITSCLDSVFKQDYSNYEVILVDNNSTDKTVEKANQYDITLVNVDEYLPGKALNIGIRASNGEFLVCLSGHCIPVNNMWLSRLIANLDDPTIAGVYGRQQPMSFSQPFDKRDLLITFGLDKIVQTKDTFFHNANSALRRSVWDEIPFDEKITNIEDRIWAHEIIKRGYKIIYEPDASVYHYHGIHQNMDPARCEKIVEILERFDVINYSKAVDLANLNVVAIIPVKGDIQEFGGRPLLEYTINRAKASRLIKQIIVTSDNRKVLALAGELGADLCIERPPELSQDIIEIQDILKFCLNEIENKKIISDIVVYLSIMYPFRPSNLIDLAIDNLVHGGYDSVIPTIKEYRSCWIEEDSCMKRVDEGFIPSKFKKPLHIGISGLVTAMYAFTIREGERLGQKVGMLELDEMLYSLDVGKKTGYQLAEFIIRDWWAKNEKPLNE
jgi:glycosyltransferase involved in cell wall biosynthesis